MGSLRNTLTKCRGFQWDEGNLDKNWRKHRVSWIECEQVFFNHPLLVAVDEEHSQEEERFFALGKAESERELFAVFAIRHDLIRVISARDMNHRERKVYDDAKKEDSEV